MSRLASRRSTRASNPLITSGSRGAGSYVAGLVRHLRVARGRVVLSSGQEFDHYVDLRRATAHHHRAARLIGSFLREVTDEWDYAAGGGLTLGADLVAAEVIRVEGLAYRSVLGLGDLGLDGF